MLKPITTKRFEKDLKRMLKSGKDKNKLKKVMTLLIHEEELSVKYREHQLKGNFKNRNECHIEPDWLLIYQISDDKIIFERTGSHSDLFK